MTEGTRIAKLFFDLQDGKPWTEVKLSDILQGITAQKAAARPIANANTIWQLVQHCIGWRENVLMKMQGNEFTSPPDNYLSMPEDISDVAWQMLLQQLEQSEKNWEKFLKSVEDDWLNAGYLPSKNVFTNYEVIHGILHHDNYHFGQILMLKKLLE